MLIQRITEYVLDLADSDQDGRNTVAEAIVYQPDELMYIIKDDILQIVCRKEKVILPSNFDVNDCVEKVLIDLRAHLQEEIRSFAK